MNNGNALPPTEERAHRLREEPAPCWRRNFTGSGLNPVSKKLSERGLLAVTAVRLVPIAPFFVISVVAGAIRIRLWHFLLGTAIGMLPGTLAATVFADRLQTALRSPGDVNY